MVAGLYRLCVELHLLLGCREHPEGGLVERVIDECLRWRERRRRVRDAGWELGDELLLDAYIPSFHCTGNKLRA